MESKAFLKSRYTSYSYITQILFFYGDNDGKRGQQLGQAGALLHSALRKSTQKNNCFQHFVETVATLSSL